MLETIYLILFLFVGGYLIYKVLHFTKNEESVKINIESSTCKISSSEDIEHDMLITHLSTLDLLFDNFLTKEIILMAYENKINEHLSEIKNGAENTEYTISDIQLARDFLINYYTRNQLI